MITALVMGMGAVGHSIVTSLDDKIVQIDVLTSQKIDVETIEASDGRASKVNNSLTYDQFMEANNKYDYIFVTLPYRFKIKRLNELKARIDKKTVLVIVPANQGAINYLPTEIKENPLILFERVPQIARIAEKYKKVTIYGTRNDLRISTINGADIDSLSKMFDYFTNIQIEPNPLAISLITSNAVLHTTRLYNLFKTDENYNKKIGFYRDWTDVDSELLLAMENEVIAIKEKMVGGHNDFEFFDLFKYFEISDLTPKAVTSGIRAMEQLNAIDFKVDNKAELRENRFLIDDCILGINYYLALAEQYDLKVPNLRKVNLWAKNFYGQDLEEEKYLNV